MIRKFHPRLREVLGDKDKEIIQIPSEEKMKEYWNASNPDSPYEQTRSDTHHLDTYPLDTWFGYIVRDDGKARLVSVIGHSRKTGKDGKPFAFIGGAKTHEDYRKDGAKNLGYSLLTPIREKNLEMLEGIPKVANYSHLGNERIKSKVKDFQETPTTHEVIPDDVLTEMAWRTEESPTASTWGVFKWQEVLKRDN